MSSRIGFLGLAYAHVYHYSQNQNHLLPNDERLIEQDGEGRFQRRKSRAERSQSHSHPDLNWTEQDRVKESVRISALGCSTLVPVLALVLASLSTAGNINSLLSSMTNIEPGRTG